MGWGGRTAHPYKGPARNPEVSGTCPHVRRLLPLGQLSARLDLDWPLQASEEGISKNPLVLKPVGRTPCVAWATEERSEHMACCSVVAIVACSGNSALVLQVACRSRTATYAVREPYAPLAAAVRVRSVARRSTRCVKMGISLPLILKRKTVPTLQLQGFPTSIWRIFWSV